MKIIQKKLENIDDFKEKLLNEGKEEITGFYDIKSFYEIVQRDYFKKNNFNCFAVFNDKIFIFEENDNITENDLFIAIVGKTKKQYEDEQTKWINDLIEKEKIWKEKVPSLIPVYIEKGHNVIDEKYWKIYDEYVPVCLNGMYHEYILDSVLEFIEVANNNSSLEEIDNKFYEQGHSGRTYDLTKFLFKEISEKGKEFYKFRSEKDKTFV